MFQKVKGFQDIYGNDLLYWSKAENALKKLVDLFAVEEIRIPILERTQVFSRGIGDATDIVEKEMFTFADRDGEYLSLRPEGTAGTVRAYIENKLYEPPVLKKLYYMGPMFRRENPQRGRYRQFSQFGTEYLGSKSALCDADLIKLFVSFYAEVGLGGFAHLEINTVGCPKCRPAYKEKLVAYLSQYEDQLCADCKKRLYKNPLRVLDCKVETCKAVTKNAPLMIDNLCEECDVHFSDLKKYLALLDVEYAINPYMVRGLDYYERTAFEMVTDKLGAASALGGGGRYDGLVKLLGGPEIPAVGFAIGMDRVVAMMKMVQELTDKKPLVYVVVFEGRSTDAGVEILNKLRHLNISAEIDYDIKGLKSQMKKAGRSGAKYAVIVGEDELSRGNVTFRDMYNSSQNEITMEEMYKIIQADK